uniref:Dolichyl-diphosphooligosaccharide--protein glycotransferase n=1 Tax=Rhabditophanes sp. KR3021 TaxID=114890 RepID=A0AC35U0I3_9BILA
MATKAKIIQDVSKIKEAKDAKLMESVEDEEEIYDGSAEIPEASSGSTTLLTFGILSLACIVAFSCRMFTAINAIGTLNEFDPQFNYRATLQLVTKGFYKFYNWFDEKSWYPIGREVGFTVFNGLMTTSATIHYVLESLNIPVHIREICIFLAPLFSGFTAIATYFLTKELWSPGAGLFAACFVAISPGYTSRSVAASYDNEGIAIFALQITFFFWIKSMKTGSMFYGVLCALSYYYMTSAWGGYVFISSIIPLHVLATILTGKYTRNIYIAYTTWYSIGQSLAMTVPFVGYQKIALSSEQMPALGIFGLLQLIAAAKFVEHKVSKRQFIMILVGLIGGTFAIGLAGILILTYAGYIAPYTGRFYSLWDTGYAKIHIPIIASVSEHQPSTWTSFFFDGHVTAAVFPVGLWYCVKNVNAERLFIILYAVTAVYFAGVMIRLMLTLTPCVCVLAGIAFSYTMENYLKEVKEDEPEEVENKKKSKEEKVDEVGMNARSIVSVCMVLLLVLYVVHCTYITSNAYSHNSIVIQSHTQDGHKNDMDDFREAYYWLNKNTPLDSKIMSWWDYGYQIAIFSNRTVLVDNNTSNNTHIATVGMAMSANETLAYEISKSLDVDYILVIFGGVIGYSGDDINKFLWMVRIAEGEYPHIIREKEYFTERGDYSVGDQASKTMTDSLMYKLSYYRFGEISMGGGQRDAFDRTRGYKIGKTDIKLEHLEEAFTSENWLVRIYKVKKPSNRENLKKIDLKLQLTPVKKNSQRK